MSSPSSPATFQPPWLRGPVAGVPHLLQPVAHSLIDAEEDVRKVLAGRTTESIWIRPNGAASIGFHVRHATGSLDRLFTYARDEPLSDEQLSTLKAEKEPANLSADELISTFTAAVERAMDQLRKTDAAALLDPRKVGRAQLPSNVIGLLFHAAEHTQRHVGQMTTTAKITG
jgi:hypothetical protein